MHLCPLLLWIFTGAPYIQWLRHRTALNAALSAITAAVVGVILNLAVWFGLHTLFSQGSTLDPFALLLSLAAMLALLRFHAGILPTMTVCALVGLLGKLLIPGL